MSLNRTASSVPEARGTDGLFTFVSFGYIILCSGASVGITKAAMVHQHDLSSHRTERERRALESFGIPS